jgi:hypothetical protein
MLMSTRVLVGDDPTREILELSAVSADQRQPPSSWTSVCTRSIGHRGSATREARLQRGAIVVCAACGQQWRVPRAVADKLSEKAQTLLSDHAWAPISEH